MNKGRPILFYGEMIRALLGGRKTQTRRVIKDFDIECLSSRHEFATAGPYPLSRKETPDYAYVKLKNGPVVGLPSPYGKPGDLLWVRETWAALKNWDMYKPCEITNGAEVHYKTGLPISALGKWRPSIHMPRWASRLTLCIKDVRVERIAAITGQDAFAEGAGHPVGTPLVHGNVTDKWNIREFSALWDSINFKNGYGWGTNPWVWVIGFEVIESNIDHITDLHPRMKM